MSRQNDADSTYSFGDLGGKNLSARDIPRSVKNDQLTVINTFGIYYAPEMLNAGILVPLTNFVNEMVTPLMWLFKKDWDEILADITITVEGQKPRLTALREKYKERVGNCGIAAVNLFNKLVDMRSTALHQFDYKVKNETVDAMRALEVRSYYRAKGESCETEVKVALLDVDADPFIIWSLEGSPIPMTDKDSIADARIQRCPAQQLISDTDEALGFLIQAAKAIFTYTGVAMPEKIESGLVFPE